MIVLTPSEIRRLLIATDVNRQPCAWVRFSSTRTITTDGHRMHVWTEGPLCDLPEEMAAHAGALRATLAMADGPDKIAIRTDRNQTSYTRGDYTLLDRREAPPPPPWNSLLNSRRPLKASCQGQPAKLRKLLRDAETEPSYSADVIQFGKGVYANRAYVLDAIKAANPHKHDVVSVECSTPLSPITVRAVGFEGIVMPCRPPK